MTAKRTTPAFSSNTRIALAHDWLVGMRGGEWVLNRLAQLFGPTKLYTLVRGRQPLTPAIDRCSIVSSPLQRFPGAAGKWRRHYLPLMPWAVGRIKVAPCDVLISTSSAVIKSIQPPPGVPHVCYCHSPARYLWDQLDDYALGAGGTMRSLALKAVSKRLREWDRRTADRVSVFIANSAHTAARIQRCYGRDAQVIYPPVRTEFFTPDPSVAREDWHLVVAALEPYKRTDLVIEAANRARLPLKVVGGGTQFKALQRIAGPNVQMLGRVPDDTLRDLYRRAKCLIFPQQEDFGMIAVEAQAAGCPVIAYASGGAAEIITPCTGVFFHEQTIDAVLSAIEQFQSMKISPHACRENAQRFAEDVFDAAILRVVQQTLAGR